MPAKSQSALTVIILAAGSGTRMKSNLPKVLHNIANKPMLYHVIDTAKDLDPSQIILVINKDMQQYLAEDELNLDIAIQQKQLGTADAVKTALAKLADKNSSLLILYGDTPLITTETLSDFLKLNSDIAMIGFKASDPTGYGRIIAGKDNIASAIIEHKDLKDEQKKINICNSGIISIKANILTELLQSISNKNAAKEFYLTDIIGLATSQKYICKYIICDDDEVSGINDRVQLSEADKIFQKRKARKLMQSGVTLMMPKTIYFSADTIIGQDSIIHPHVTFGTNVVIGKNNVIQSFCHIENTITKDQCEIGPFARLRAGNVLSANSKIGNFVEVKKSNIGKKTKINHLSYIGDANIGENVNIGAGVITCNYNGFQKNKTSIGDNAFIGSNAALIAPINIGKAAMVAAGSTINEDVPADAIAFAREKQKNVLQGASKLRKKFAGKK